MAKRRASVHWTESVALARRHGVKIYACLAESRVRDETGKMARASLEALRARALAAWAAGVDGIEMFNHFDPKSPLWRELADPVLLRTLPKVYFASVQGAGQSRSFYPAGRHLALPTLTPDAPEKFAAGAARTYEFFLGDDLRTTTTLAARLDLRVADATGKTPRVQWDGAALAVAAGQGGWSTPLPAASIKRGLHRVTLPAVAAFRLDDLQVQIE